jgi:hypothetical protein
LENISPDELALEVLHQCLRGNSPSPELLDALIQSGDARASHALFSIVVERLADLFEPCLCDAYAALFSEVIARTLPIASAPALLSRHKRIRAPRRFHGGAATVFVLSRVTLGADVAVTSIALAAAKQRFPDAEIVFVGPRKNFELFAADPRLRHAEIPYARSGGLRERLEIYYPLAELLSRPDSIVIDPDSRLTQLGLLPVGDEDRYYFFESRSYGEYGEESLVELTRRWMAETFSTPDVRAYIAPRETGPEADVTVSLGVGENQAKRLGDVFERALLEELAAAGGTILVDRGGSAGEAARVDAVVEGLPGVQTFSGAFAPFAASIAKSKLYCGYDSAGQHVAAACGTPLLTVFAGYASLRMFHRWRPDGPGRKSVVRVDSQDGDAVMEECRRALVSLRVRR